MQEEFGPQPSAFIPARFEAQTQTEASTERMFQTAEDRIFSSARSFFEL